MAHRVISLIEVVKVNRQNDILPLTSVQLLQVRNILFTQNYLGGDEDDDPIVPPN